MQPLPPVTQTTFDIVGVGCSQVVTGVGVGVGVFSGFSFFFFANREGKEYVYCIIGVCQTLHHYNKLLWLDRKYIMEMEMDMEMSVRG